MEVFGGLDILVNNASAIQMVPVEKMEVKRYDLIQSINSRGTFVASKYAIPHLRKSKNPHILSISPPLYMGNDPHINWFAATGTGYTLGKFGMTLITHGLAGELKVDGIACNTLWPRSTIQSAAIANVWGKKNMEVARKPGIMADAAHTIFTSESRLTTDNCFIDDEVMLSTGMTLGELDAKYLPEGLPNWKLAPDFFV